MFQEQKSKSPESHLSNNTKQLFPAHSYSTEELKKCVFYPFSMPNQRSLLHKKLIYSRILIHSKANNKPNNFYFYKKGSKKKIRLFRKINVIFFISSSNQKKRVSMWLKFLCWLQKMVKKVSEKRKAKTQTTKIL